MLPISRRFVLAGALIASTRLVGGCGGSTGTAAAPAPTPAPPPPPPPPWAAQAQSGTWSDVPMLNTLGAVDPIKDPAVNPNYPSSPEWAENQLRQRAVVDSWCGAAYDETTDTMWLGLGGGHRDYAGNEIYKCGFYLDGPSWQMVRKPSGAIGNLLTTDDHKEASGIYADGRPRAIHTYNKWVYAPGTGPILMALGPGSWAGAAVSKLWSAIINEADGEHTFTSAEATYIQSVDAEGGGAAYDPIRNAVWVTARNTTLMGRYNIPDTGPKHVGSYTTHGPPRAKNNETSICHIPGHDVLLVGNSSYDRSLPNWYIFDPVTDLWHTPTITGRLPGGIGPGSTQPRWVPSLGAACCWDNTSQTTLIAKLTPGPDPRSSWTISTLPVSASNAVTPTAATPAGTFNRFAYSPRLGGFLVFNSTTGPTHFYKI